jgi:DNA-binding MarR family transcriptional regulator
MGPPVSAPWSILLELYLNAERYIPLSLGDMALLTGIAPTTSLDWLHKLSRMGLVAKVPDPGDGRRFHVSLTPQGTEVTEKLLSDLARVFVHSRNAQ